jgi:hypothetical protein
MTIPCDEARHSILESLDRPASGMPAEATAHLGTCEPCARFAAVHHRLDARLSREFMAPQLDSRSRHDLRQRLPNRQPRLWAELAPDILHFAGCGAAALVCALASPHQVSAIAALGLISGLSTYCVIALVRNSLEDHIST